MSANDKHVKEEQKMDGKSRKRKAGESPGSLLNNSFLKAPDPKRARVESEVEQMANAVRELCRQRPAIAYIEGKAAGLTKAVEEEFPPRLSAPRFRPK